MLAALFKFVKKRSLTAICALCMCLMFTGTYAMWLFAAPAPVAQKNINVLLGLPNYPEEGEDHKALLDALVGTEGAVAHSLNDPDSLINVVAPLRQDGGRQRIDGQLITFDEGRDTVGSMAIVLRSEFEELYANAAQNIDFVLFFPHGSDVSPYYIFTWDVLARDKDGYATQLKQKDSDAPITKSMIKMDVSSRSPSSNVWTAPVYRTTVEKINGVWTQTKVEMGYAKASFYEENSDHWLFGARPYKSQLMSIYPQSWVAA